ncbi:hypothetical protein K437DRAFT_264711 [Tilletiaria anomala UBC 951]|uniref:Autophagy-related protein 14 n=1 Tax=Tilletiaria anomala (strain ATCC 24038 / CBS 436.72 / UBC 951) TaxID=1037660 RepID=A0A066VBR7_TILAU|nr:uncharacterized protein K437DRAFT_264711 [Tilletiaria anomala UBC 951]KDN38876.1 hypothetical protein K437DRAFT_264711 [Tilletiaria anomala UBC 951]
MLDTIAEGGQPSTNRKVPAQNYGPPTIKSNLRSAGVPRSGTMRASGSPRTPSEKERLRPGKTAMGYSAAHPDLIRPPSGSHRHRARHHAKRVPFDGQCRFCKQSQLKGWFCQDCLSKRIDDHLEDRRRIGEKRVKGAGKVKALLGPTSSVADLMNDINKGGRAANDFSHLNPFSDGDSSTPRDGLDTVTTVGHIYRSARAWQSMLQDSLQRLKHDSNQSSSDVSALKQALKRRKRELAHRRQNLAAAQQLELQQQEHNDVLTKSPGAWPVQLGSNEMDNREYPGILARVARVKHKIEELRAIQDRLASDLSVTRKLLVVETLGLFNIQPPAGTLAKEGRVSGLIALRAQQAFATAAAHTLRGKETSRTTISPTASDWTILGVVLPQPHSIHRFALDDINGAVSHATALLQLLSSYLGVMLPFQPSYSSRDVCAVIQPSEYWAGSGIEAGKHLLQLEESAYQALLPKQDTPTANVGHSALDMAASAFEGAKSFIHISSGYFPGSASIISSKSPDAQTGCRGADSDEEDTAVAKDQLQTSDVSREKRKSRKVDLARAVKSFRSALVMLAYDAAYLAETQGALLSLDIYDGVSSNAIVPSAVAVPLRILRHLSSSKMLGHRSHEATDAASNIRTFDFARLDFMSLYSFLVPSESRESKAKKEEILMEGSYVDAKWDAASVILRDKNKDKSKGKSKSKSSGSGAPAITTTMGDTSSMKSNKSSSSKPSVSGRQENVQPAAAAGQENY